MFNVMARKVVAPELDFDEPEFSSSEPTPTFFAEVDFDVPGKPTRRRKPKPDEEARDAPPANWRRFGWYKAPKATLPGFVVGFAYMKEKNDAGFYVSFTIIWRGAASWRGVPTRSNFHGWKTKRAAKEYCLDRWNDARKPKRERRYTIKPPA